MEDRAKQKEITQSLVLKSSYIAWIQLVLAAAIGVGAFLAYSESKYVSKELYNSEVATLKDVLKDQSSKLDEIYRILLEKKRE